eukprot:1138976-Pleurochrysis_carterae.AAC.1
MSCGVHAADVRAAAALAARLPLSLDCGVHHHFDLLEDVETLALALLQGEVGLLAHSLQLLLCEGATHVELEPVRSAPRRENTRIHPRRTHSRRKVVHVWHVHWTAAAHLTFSSSLVCAERDSGPWVDRRLSSTFSTCECIELTLAVSAAGPELRGSGASNAERAASARRGTLYNGGPTERLERPLEPRLRSVSAIMPAI